jgi:hypothetical protein
VCTGQLTDLAHHAVRESRVGHDEVTLFEALADPIVQALMVADGVDTQSADTLMRSIAARLPDDAEDREVRQW